MLKHQKMPSKLGSQHAIPDLIIANSPRTYSAKTSPAATASKPTTTTHSTSTSSVIKSNSLALGSASSLAAAPSPPPGCSRDYNGWFELSPIYVSSSKQSLGHGATGLEISLSNGSISDTSGRTGYVASNDQLQFDEPPQAGAIYTTGFSVCKRTRVRSRVTPRRQLLFTAQSASAYSVLGAFRHT